MTREDLADKLASWLSDPDLAEALVQRRLTKDELAALIKELMCLHARGMIHAIDCMIGTGTDAEHTSKSQIMSAGIRMREEQKQYLLPDNLEDNR